MKSFTIPANIGDFSDAQIFRLARKVASHDKELSFIEAELKAQRAEQKAQRVEVRRTKAQVQAATGASAVAAGRVRATATGLTAGPVRLGGKGFTVSQQALLRGAGSMFYVFAATRAAGALANAWERERDTLKQYGAGEVGKRVAAAVFRTVLGTMGGLVGDTLGEIAKPIAGFFGDAAVEGVKRSIEQIRNPKRIRTGQEALNRLVAAENKAQQWVDEEVSSLQAYVPTGVTVGTSLELLNLRMFMRRFNEGEIADARQRIVQIELEAMD